MQAHAYTNRQIKIYTDIKRHIRQHKRTIIHIQMHTYTCIQPFTDIYRYIYIQKKHKKA